MTCQWLERMPLVKRSQREGALKKQLEGGPLIVKFQYDIFKVI